MKEISYFSTSYRHLKFLQITDFFHGYDPWYTRDKYQVCKWQKWSHSLHSKPNPTKVICEKILRSWIGANKEWNWLYINFKISFHEIAQLLHLINCQSTWRVCQQKISFTTHIKFCKNLLFVKKCGKPEEHKTGFQRRRGLSGCKRYQIKYKIKVMVDRNWRKPPPQNIARPRVLSL